MWFDKKIYAKDILAKQKKKNLAFYGECGIYVWALDFAQILSNNHWKWYNEAKYKCN